MKGLTGTKNKELFLIDGATHIQTYWKPEYVEQEKNNIKQIIEGKIDNKAKYSLDRCIEEMYKDEPFGLYKFGYTEDLENIKEIDNFLNVCHSPKLNQGHTTN